MTSLGSRRRSCGDICFGCTVASHVMAVVRFKPRSEEFVNRLLGSFGCV